MSLFYILYFLLSPIIFLILILAIPFNKKIREHWINGRKTLQNAVNKNLKNSGAHSVVDSHVFSDGGDGGVELAQAVVEAASEKSSVKYLYDKEDSIEAKVSSLAKTVYGAKDVSWNQQSKKRLKLFNDLGWGKLPVCMAKTHLSISDKPRLKGHPTGYTFNISDVRASIGAGFIYPIAGTIPTMPGLPNSPKALDIDDNGSIIGL